MLSHVKPHPADPFTLVTSSQDAFLAATRNYGAEQGVIWDRSDENFSALRQEYSDLFNNASGVRSDIDKFFSQHRKSPNGYINQIGATIEKDNSIRFFSRSHDNLTSSVNALLSEFPHLRYDIETGVRRVVQNPHISKFGATIWLLSDYPNKEKIREIQYKYPHTDPGDTFYIQCGGAHLHMVKYNTDSSLKDNHFQAKNGDIIYMRGKNYPPFMSFIRNVISGNPHHNQRPMTHFGKAENILEQGRISFAIF